MDTIQIDAKKLQLLNDRINQTIDALNQLRVTAQQTGFGFGLGHTSVPWQVSPQAQLAGIFGAQAPFALQGMDPWTVARQQALAMQAALGHTSVPSYPFPNAYAQSLYGQGLYGQGLYGQGIYGQGVYGQGVYGQGVYGQGLGHTSVPQYNPIQNAYAQNLAAYLYGNQGFGGLGHSSVRWPAAEIVGGAWDPFQRQVEINRAQEANRAWEMSQGLSHSTYVPSSFGGGSQFAGIGSQTPFYAGLWGCAGC